MMGTADDRIRFWRECPQRGHDRVLLTLYRLRTEYAQIYREDGRRSGYAFDVFCAFNHATELLELLLHDGDDEGAPP